MNSLATENSSLDSTREISHTGKRNQKITKKKKILKISSFQIPFPAITFVGDFEDDFEILQDFAFLYLYYDFDVYWEQAKKYFTLQYVSFLSVKGI